MNSKKTITVSMILAGATAIMSQVVFMREFLVIFYGNEISIGIILASWLIWGACGSLLIGRFSDRISSKMMVFSMCQALLAFILPATLLLIRSSKIFMGITTGEITGFSSMFISTFIILSVSCVIMGFMFSLGCRIYRDITDAPSLSVARVYIMEAVGALFGGVLVSYFMVPRLSSYTIIFFLAILNLAASVFVQFHGERTRIRKIVFNLTVGVFIVIVCALFLGGASWLKNFSFERLWSGFDVLESKNSIYGNITVTRKGEQRSFYENGLHLYTVPDLLSSEEAVHFTLLENESVEDVLLIGGGIGGLVEEALKHPVKKVDYIELDPVMIRMAKKYLKKENVAFFQDPRVNVVNMDGRFFVKKTRNKYDCVIINLGDPYTAQLNRFYTVDFFREIDRVLKPGGIISFALTSSENYMSKELTDYLRSIYYSVKKVFSDVIIIPGDTLYLIAGREKNKLTYDIDILMERLQKRNIDAKYVREYYLFDKLSSERISYAVESIVKGRKIDLNTDFKPISYYYATVFWGTQFDMPFLKDLYGFVSSKNIWLLVILFLLFIIIFCALQKKRDGKNVVLIAVMTTGFSEIIFQIAVILSFQVIYGYVYYKLGIIMTSFMAGLALGGWLVSKKMFKYKNGMVMFIRTQTAICVYPLLLPVIFWWLSGAKSDITSWFGANIIFPFLPIIAGIIGGIQFPLANHLCIKKGEEVGRIAGLSYGLDLFGACIGSFLAAAFLIPILGIFQTCLLASVINAGVLVLLVLSRSRG
ncbi:MAG: methyltransferase domain-containing protein [Candidatus Omnitrophota bacterium]